MYERAETRFDHIKMALTSEMTHLIFIDSLEKSAHQQKLRETLNATSSKQQCHIFSHNERYNGINSNVLFIITSNGQFQNVFSLEESTIEYDTGSREKCEKRR